MILTRKSRFFLRRNVDVEFCSHIVDMGKIHGGNYEEISRIKAIAASLAM